ncbi:hypothetical protein Glove_130g169 [Diversispora epigaea]|uniref:Protein kinase domain-containing protein n=1 Tax=Diversispora epigaea TaxID=1348612 RepID=A0A397IY64_9GLOM|nr:hypothetical protein Glove_130g169 [Diversispora epigaea]
MSQEKTNEHEAIREWETWMDNLVIKDTLQKENIPFYQYSEFDNVELISGIVYKATFKTSRKAVVLKCISLNDNFTLDNLNNLINEIKIHRKLKIHDSILKFYGVTNKEDTNNYMIILEYANNNSLRQYLKTNFQKLDWNAKLNIAKQIANVLTILHSNDIIYGKLNSENILIHNGIIKFNIFGLTKIMPESLRLLTNVLGPIQYVDPQYLEIFKTIGKNKSSDIFSLGIILWEISSGNPPFEMESLSNVDLLNNILKGKREMVTPGTPSKYKEIYIDCWKHNGNSRPDISQVVKNLSELIISDAIGTPRSQPRNVTNGIISVKLEKQNIQNEESKVHSDPLSVDKSAEVKVFIKDLFEFFIGLYEKQDSEIHPIMIKNYIRKHKKNPVEILCEIISHPSHSLFTSLIGFFYKNGIGTITDNQMAFKFFSIAANEIIDTSSSNSSSLMKLYNTNKEIGTISLADMHLNGTGVGKDTKAFQIYSKLADEGSLIALISVAYCYQNGFGVKKNEEKAFELWLKSAEKGILVAQSRVGWCYRYGIGTPKDVAKGFQWCLKAALAGNIGAICNTGFCYNNGEGVVENKKEAFKWYLKAAVQGNSGAQYNLGNCLENGNGINKDQTEAFEWYKKAAECNYIYGQYKVGKCFYEGSGTKKDIVKAIYWLNKAKENGYIDANRLLKEIIK